MISSEAAGPEAKITNPKPVSILSGAASFFSAQFIRRAGQAAFALIAARLLDPASFGVYAFLLAIVEILAVVSGSGFSDYLAREASKAPQAALRLSFSLTKLRVVYILCLVGVTLPGLAALGYSATTLKFAALFCTILFPRSVLDSSQGILRSLEMFQPIVWLEILQAGVRLLVGVPLLRLGFGVEGMIWAEVACTFVGAFAAMPVILRKVPLGERLWAGWKKLVSDTLAFNFYPLIVNLYDRIDVILLSRLAGNFAVGIYALPYRGFAMLQMIPYGLMGALLPSLSKSDWDAHARERSAQIMKFLYLAALFSIQATTLLGHTVIGFAFGEAYQASARVLEILIWATIPMFLNFGLNTFLLARNREKVFLRTASVCLFVNIAANAILIPRYSYVAAASVTILTEIALLIQNVLLMREHFGFVPLPEKLWRVNIGFLLTLGVGLTALPHLPAVAVTFATLSLFAIYLYVSKSAPNVSQWARSPLGSPRVSLENQ